MRSVFCGLTLAAIVVTVLVLCQPETVLAQRGGGGGGRPSLGHVGGGGVKHAGGGGGNFKMPSSGARSDRPCQPIDQSLGNAHSGGMSNMQNMANRANPANMANRAGGATRPQTGNLPSQRPAPNLPSGAVVVDPTCPTWAWIVLRWVGSGARRLGRAPGQRRGRAFAIGRLTTSTGPLGAWDRPNPGQSTRPAPLPQGPGTRPSLPNDLGGLGGNRPSLPMGERPTVRPPQTKPPLSRPTPDRPTTRPGDLDRPTTRPVPDRPTTRLCPLIVLRLGLVPDRPTTRPVP